MAEPAAGKILVVDDEQEMRQMIADYLRDVERYLVSEAENAEKALDLLERQHFDLVLSDINMPGMKGFDLLHVVKDKYPLVKRVLITAYNVEDYFDMAIKYDIGNIFVKTTPFNFSELSMIIRNLLLGSIFGLEPYFEETVQKTGFRIRNARQLDVHARVISEFIGDRQRSKQLEVVIVELLTNAMFYGVQQESPENKDTWNIDVELPESKAIAVTVARDSEKYGISISDEGGRLKKADALFWMNRQIARDVKGMPLGLFDTHGRGLFIVRRYIDRLIINVQNGVRTEVVIINYPNKTFSGYKPLYINEL